MEGRPYDLAVIGGGLTGVAIARDAAGRGLSVFLCDEGDLGGRMSATNHVIHGRLDLMAGMRLGAMREAVTEREILMHAAPHLLRPLRFLVPHHQRLWSKAALRLGLAVFDHAARNSLPSSRRVDLESEDAHGALQPHFATAFSYSDCFADDSRLVILNALDAREHGASIRPRVRCTVAERDGGQWRLSLESAATGDQGIVRASALINAAGADVAEVHNHVIHSSRPVTARLRKSTCIVVRRDRLDTVGYALPNADGRIVFAFQWQAGTMLIGTAERDAGSGANAEVERRDVGYLIDVARQYFETPVWTDDIVRSFAGLHAVPRDGSAAEIVVDAPPHVAPLVTVIGGTVAGHRRLAERVVDGLARFRPVAPSWTRRAVLPGGGFPARGGGDLVRALRAAYPFLEGGHAERLVRAYGTRASMILTGARTAADLGTRFGSDLTGAEVEYLRKEEWAVTAEDILWRRSGLGLALTADEASDLAARLESMPLAAEFL